MVYNEDDEIDGLYFMTKGLSAFILPKLSGMIFAIIDPEKTVNADIKRKMHVFQYHGIEDSILNHLKMINEEKQGRGDRFVKAGESLLNKRRYSVQCIR